ncbi:hypothetical protein [Nocardioides zeae]|uniref:Uncharacterized protein n=1 Tax=Nocardioides zeae TaxID=1457234 RepID=A0AAJ1U5N2_9ACTN|nr:hypothetical protein [Nocardioides zeae]MDQ1104582.1 hypothetical protein [Nocardioides zeae]
MRQSRTTPRRVTEWAGLVERTLRGALEVDHVVVLTRSSPDPAPPAGSPPDAPPVQVRPGGAPPEAEAGDLLVVRHVDPAGRPVDLVLRRVGRDFTTLERRLAVGILEALERASRDEVRPAPAPLPQADVVDALERSLHDLDDMVVAPLVDRLAMVGNRFASRLDAAAWCLGRRTGDWAMETVTSSVRRRESVAGARGWLRRTGASPEITWRSSLTSTALEGGSVVAWRGEDSEVAQILESWGDLETLVAAGGYDLDARQWLLTLVGDETSPDLRQAQAALSAAVQVALGFPRAPRHH